MNIVSGLFDRIVMQRNPKNRSDQLITGTCSRNAGIVVSVTKNARKIHALTNKLIGKARGQTFEAKLEGLPVGGPYNITLTEVDLKGRGLDNIVCKDILVGDVWLLAGQSNMEGLGMVHEKLAPLDKVRAFYMDNRWDKAEDPIHNLADACAPAHQMINGGVKISRNLWSGTGPGVAFGQTMFAETGIPQGLIASAHGGTGIDQWDPKTAKSGDESLFGAMINRVNRNGGAIAGFIWYQGENDAEPKLSQQYGKKLKRLLNSIRKRLNRIELPAGIVQIGRTATDGSLADCWHSVREQQRQIADQDPRSVIIPSIDLELDDKVHIAGFEQHHLGKRIACAMLSLIDRKYDRYLPLRLRKSCVGKHPLTPWAFIELEFDNVVGKLTSAGRPSGFRLTHANKELEIIYRIELDKNKVRLHVHQVEAALDGTRLYYGYGTNPYCNITDTAGKILPAFGPVAFGKPKAMTEFVLTAAVSDFFPLSTPDESLTYPDKINEISFTPNRFVDAFLSRHRLMAAHAPQSVLCYYRLYLDCHETMETQILLGYDGPVHVWFDKQLTIQDLHGNNPAYVDRARAKISAAKGIHEVLVALSSNSGNAWGIMLRFQRLDVPKALIKSNAYAHMLPCLIVES
ncbi:MAG: hypothetical protein GF398_03495 [Chitinivibrionales bacterium]|nr:hypothetical protein [Chitinivibrionales bacterium]